tara:strand:- start:284 stop:553 length:270 start_codon:yes stop_codon:yes gene_type:complete
MEVRVKKGILYFTAPWCEPCQQLGPRMEQLIESGIPVRKINTDYDATLTEKYKVTSIPTLIVTDLSGNEIKRMQGAGKTVQQLNEWYNG